MTASPDVQGLPTVSLSSRKGIEVSLIALGARVTGLMAPDRDGVMADVVLGHDRPEDYLTVGGYLGATCGRFANRIAHGRFPLDGREMVLDRNHGDHQLHGGSNGFDRKIWEVVSQSPSHVSFSTHSVDGEMGFPGAVDTSCTYQLLDDHRLLIEMLATTTTPTVVNLANHAYFNLAGQGMGDVMGHQLKLYSTHYTPVDASRIPTGDVLGVTGTAFDFTDARPIGRILPEPGGFDHNFCMTAPVTTVSGEFLRPAADLVDPGSGRALKLWTSEVGLQVYTGAHFDGSQPGKKGQSYGRFAGVALETQKFPDAPNRPQFPSARLDPGHVYRHLVLWDFSPAGP